ncbi:MAG: TolC family protein [Gemmataceae bacterium]|nr:TolC family protein [Gemmataceae bacterium]
MSKTYRSNRRGGFWIAVAFIWATTTIPANAQPEIIQSTPVSREVVRPTTPTTATAAEETAPPVSPAVSPGPMSLEACLKLGNRHQPAIDAARASLSAANSGKRGLDRLFIPRLFTPDLGIRKQQASEGITIAEAGLIQAEWETRYSITRNFFTVQYIRAQQEVINDVLSNLEKGTERAKKIFGDGDPDGKITRVDLDFLDVQLGLVEKNKAQIDNGMLKALAALREAMGLSHNYPLEIGAIGLPPAVREEIQMEKDKKGKDVKKITFHRVYKINREDLILAALSNRGEMIQASAANRVVNLEISAQNRALGWRVNTFGSGSDVHAKPIPQGIFNNDYRPGAIGLEIAPTVVGRKAERVQHVTDFAARSSAVVDKTTNLISLDVEAMYLKWQEAVSQVESLTRVVDKAISLPKRVQELNPREFTSTAIIQANTVAIMVRTQLNDALHTHALALAGLERATAGAFHIYPVPAVSPSVTNKVP